MTIWTEHPDLTPTVLSAFAVQILEERPIEEHILAQWFPVAINPNLAYQLNAGSLRSYTTALGYRAYDTQAGPGQRYGYETLEGRLPPFGQTLELTEGEILELQQNSVPDWVRDEIYGDVENLVRALQARHEIDRGLTLINGAMSLTGNLSSLSVDWGRDASLEVTPGTLWSAGGDPFGDERAVFRYMRSNYRAPAVVLMPTEVIDVLEVHTDYLTTYQGITGAASAPLLLTLEQINICRRQYELPPVVRYDVTISTETGGTAKVLDGKHILMLPDGPVGQTQYGRPLIANEPDVNIARNLGGPVVFLERANSVPVNYNTQIDGIGLPLLGAKNDTARLTVLA